jgi:hypothetical protein
MRQYDKLVIQDRVDNGMRLKDALKIYNNFHQLTRAPDWGDIPSSWVFFNFFPIFSHFSFSAFGFSVQGQGLGFRVV